MSALSWFLVAAGGASGACARQAITLWMGRHFATWPAATFFANVSGCLLIGLLAGLNVPSSKHGTELSFLLVTGFCGGYTTFSSFGLQFWELWRVSPFDAGAYAFLSLAVCLVAVLCGLWLGGALTDRP